MTKLWREPDRGIYEIQVIAADGFVQKIEATDDHPFYVVEHGWKNTLELNEGDLLESNLGEPLTVKSVINENRTDLTYNFTVADFSTYYVTERNVLVHNCPPTGAAKRLNNGANSASNGLKFKKQLASQEQLGQLSKGGGDVISQPAKQATRIASETGQNAQDIQKVTSSVRKFSDGSQVETHAFRNAKTNELIQPKTIVNPRQR